MMNIVYVWSIQYISNTYDEYSVCVVYTCIQCISNMYDVHNVYVVYTICEQYILTHAEADEVVAAKADPGLRSEAVSSLPQLPTASSGRNSPLCGGQGED